MNQAMRILVVDDDRVIVHLLSSRLRAKGLEIVPAYDAMQTWMAVIKGGIDAVVLDIQMPGGTGIEVLRELKSFTKTSMVPVIVLSGSINPAQVKQVKDLGADEYFPKPPDAEQLYECLARLLRSPAAPERQTFRPTSTRPNLKQHV